MKSVEKSGRTVDEAVEEGLAELGVDRTAVDVEVLEEGSKGLFGLLGSRAARVRLTLVEPGGGSGPSAAGAPQKADPASGALPTQGAEASGDAAEPTDTAPSTAESEAEERAARMERARTFVVELLGRMGIEAGVAMREADENIVHLAISGDGMGLVIGRRGQTLDALQYLTNMAANRGPGPRLRFVLDAEGYRGRREEYLTDLAQRMAERVRREGRKAVLDPMSALERRVVHMALQDEAGIETESEGEDPFRRVVIVPKRS